MVSLLGFDNPEKLDYPGLPDYPAWYSRLKDEHVFSLSDFQEWKKIFKEKGMQTFADWLRYYNDLHVAPGLEALEEMRALYKAKGMDILKDADSLPGVSLYYLLRETVKSTLLSRFLLLPISMHLVLSKF